MRLRRKWREWPKQTLLKIYSKWTFTEINLPCWNQLWPMLRRIKWAWRTLLSKLNKYWNKKGLKVATHISVNPLWIPRLPANHKLRIRFYNLSSIKRDLKLSLKSDLGHCYRILLSVPKLSRKELELITKKYHDFGLKTINYVVD